MARAPGPWLRERRYCPRLRGTRSATATRLAGRAAGACTINRPCAQKYVGKSQSCMVISGRLIVHAPVQNMAATTELQEFIARVETAAVAKEAASMAMLPPNPDRSGMLRRLSSKVSESVSASPSPRTRRESQILGVGQQLFQVFSNHA